MGIAWKNILLFVSFFSMKAQIIEAKSMDNTSSRVNYSCPYYYLFSWAEKESIITIKFSAQLNYYYLSSLEIS